MNMKKIKYIVLNLVILLFPLSVNALTGNVSVSCAPSQAKPGDIVNCSFSGSTDGIITGISAKVTINGAVTVPDNDYYTAPRTVWSGGGDYTRSNGYIDNYTSIDQPVSGNFEIGVLKLKVNTNASPSTVTITISNVEVSDKDGRDIDTGFTGGSGTFNVVINTEPEPVTPKGLKSLTPTIGVLGPQFLPDELGYVLTIPASATTFGFMAVAQDSSDEIVFSASGSSTPISNPQNIEFAPAGGNKEMLIHINVGTGDRETVYAIVIRKDVSTGDTNELSSLKVGDQTVTLVSGKYKYDVVLNDVTSYQIVADLKDRENFEIVNLANLSPRSGEGEFYITISPKDSASGLEGTIYTINVSKSGGSSTPSSPSSSSKIINPPTGGAASIIMALILIISFGVSIYYYKKNISYINK